MQAEHPFVPKYIYRARDIQRDIYSRPVDHSDLEIAHDAFFSSSTFYPDSIKSPLDRLEYFKRIGYAYMHELRDRLAAKYENELVTLGDKNYDWKFNPRFLGHSEDEIFLCAGAGINISFEIELAKAYPHAKVFILDPSPQSVAHFKDFPLPSNLSFEPIGLGGCDGITEFHKPNVQGVGSLSTKALNPGDHAFELPISRVSTFLESQNLSSEKLSFLKFDIEGAEHDVIDDLCRTGLLPKQIALEFDQPVPPWTIERSLKALARHGYELVSVWELNVLLIRRTALQITDTKSSHG